MDPLVSVVIPIYNVEDYLETCVVGILNQQYRNLEIILVNDGSQDRCGDICKHLSMIDRRIIVLEKENGGLSSARNAGIEKATGKYIVFIDPDDQICEDYFSKLVSTAEQNNCEVVVSGFKTVPNNITKEPGYQLNQVMRGKDLILSSPNVHSNNDLCFVWRYIYNLNHIKKCNIRFNRKLFIGEDVIFNLELLSRSERVIAIPETIYLYTVNNPNSLMRKPYKPNLESSLILQYELRKKLSITFGLLTIEHYKRDMSYYCLNHIYRLIIGNIRMSQLGDINEEIVRIANYDLVRDSIKNIGFTYRCNSLKEYIYFLALKLKIYPLLRLEFRNNIC